MARTFAARARQVALAPVRAAIIRNEDSLLRSGIDRCGCGPEPKPSEMSLTAAGSGTLRTPPALITAIVCPLARNNRPCIGRGIWIHPNPARNIGQARLVFANSFRSRAKQRARDSPSYRQPHKESASWRDQPPGLRSSPKGSGSARICSSAWSEFILTPLTAEGLG